MKREAEAIVRPSKRHEGANLKETRAAMERSRSIYFQRTLPQTAITPAPANQTRPYLTLPPKFVRDNAKKVEEWVILRVKSSIGRSSQPWVVRLYIIIESAVATTVRFAAGWKDFAAGNGLRMGDSLIFLLKEDMRSEFEVHVFRGPGGFPYFPDLYTSSTAADDDDEDEEEKYDYDDVEEIMYDEETKYDHDDDGEEKYVSNSEEKKKFAEDSGDDSDYDDKQSPVRARAHHRDSRTRASTRKGLDSKAIPAQQTKHFENNKAFPGFRKEMTISNIPQSDSSSLTSSGQFEFPRHFVKTHGKHLQASVQLQGVHDDSPVYVTPCFRCKHVDGVHVRISLKSREWSRFARANGLKVGQELQFSLTADSYFEVRVV